MSAKLIYVTAPSRKAAEQIAETVVTERLAACANIIDGVFSVFRWKGKICRETEALLILKTAENRSGELSARVKQLHPYECPCIAVLPVEGGNPDFLQWIEEETLPG